MAKKKRQVDKIATPERAAKLEFEPIPDLLSNMMSRAEFLAKADVAYNVLVIGAGVLAKTPDELAGVLKAVSSGDEERKAIFGIIDELNATKEWFAGFASVLGSIEARTWIAASRFAMTLETPS